MNAPKRLVAEILQVAAVARRSIGRKYVLLVESDLAEVTAARDLVLPRGPFTVLRRDSAPL